MQLIPHVTGARACGHRRQAIAWGHEPPVVGPTTAPAHSPETLRRPAVGSEVPREDTSLERGTSRCVLRSAAYAWCGSPDPYKMGRDALLRMSALLDANPPTPGRGPPASADASATETVDACPRAHLRARFRRNARYEQLWPTARPGGAASVMPNKFLRVATPHAARRTSNPKVHAAQWAHPAKSAATFDGSERPITPLCDPRPVRSRLCTTTRRVAAGLSLPHPAGLRAAAMH